jgi:undecaprenyl-diphosphatase
VKVLHRWDSQLSARLTLPPTDPKWPLAARTAHLGDGTLVFLGLGLAYLAGWLFDQPFLRLAMIVLLATLLITATIIVFIKYTLRRERPRDPTGFVTIAYDKYSFPSGHSARMSCLAITVLFFYPPIGLILVLLALLVALARVVIGVHYVADVVVGLAIGAIIAASFVGWLDLVG